ncbi:hypothetical protein AAMO2058_000806300 [Amorphochlora amoebiformis]
MIYTLTFVALSLPLAHSIQIENPETTITTSVSTDPASTKAVSGAFADGSRPSRSCGRELVILRTSSPSDSFIERYTRLKNEIAGERDLMISFNAHNSSELAMVDKTGIDVVKNLMAKAEDARSRLESAFENDFYAYTDRDMLALFPSLAELPKFVRGRNSLPSYAYYLHDEATMVAIKQWASRNQKNFDGCGVWVLEDDLEYTGNWNELMNNYSNGFDLASANIRFNDKFQKSPWQDYCSKRFKERFVIDGLVGTHDEHIVYYSRRLIFAIYRELSQGSHAQSEMGSATMCHVLGCRNIKFNETDLDPDYYKNHKLIHSDDEIKTHIAQLRAVGINKLIHPAKY